MNELSKNIKEDTRLLDTHLGQLQRLGQDTFRKRIRVDHQNDHLGVVAAFFVSKQLVHLDSLLLLVRAKQHSDAAVISRLMLEGMGILLWICRDPEKRALSWRKYSLVSDLRLMEKRMKQGTAVSPEDENQLRNRVACECKEFLKKSVQKHDDSTLGFLGDSYRKSWLVENGNQLQIKDIFVEIESVEHYEIIYLELCNWVHWNPGGFAQMLEWQSDTLSFHPNPVNEGSSALMTAFQALYETLRVLISHLDLTNQNELEKIKDNLIESLSREQKSQTS